MTNAPVPCVAAGTPTPAPAASPKRKAVATEPEASKKQRLLKLPDRLAEVEREWHGKEQEGGIGARLELLERKVGITPGEGDSPAMRLSRVLERINEEL